MTYNNYYSMASDNCPICLERASNCTFQPCLHKICGNCVPRWVTFKTAKQCLMCRQKINNILLADGYSISMEVLIDNSNSSERRQNNLSEGRQNNPSNNISNVTEAIKPVINTKVSNAVIKSFLFGMGL